MREILFRAWDKVSKKYREFDGMHDTMTINEDGKVEYYNLQNGSGGDEYILEQFTGLHDKNGKMIFEGDIVKIYHVRLVFDGPVFPPQLANITWDECGFRLEGPEISSTNPDLYPSSHLEIIGNIHDNPELMEDE